MSRESIFTHSAPRALLAAIALIAAGCKSDGPTGSNAAASLAIAGAYAQLGIVGQQLQSPLVVQVNDAAGNPVANQAVSFSVSANGGSVSGPGTTDENGRASVAWTLGTVAGPDTLTARLGQHTVQFIAHADPGSLAAFAAVSGDQQQVAAGSDASFVVKALDGFGNALSGLTLLWVSQNGGSLSATSTVTDASGLARVTLTTDPASGVQYVVLAQSPDGSVSIAFTVTGM